MNSKRNIFISVYIIIPLGILCLTFSVNNCERFEPIWIPVITTDTVEILAGGNFKLVGTVVNIGKDEIEQHGFCWSDSENPTTEGASTQLGPRNSKGSFTSTISGLTPNTAYFYRSYVTTSSVTDYGKERSFNTPPLAVPTVITSAIDSIFPNAATGGGEVTDNGGSEVTGRGVCWSTSQDPTIADSLTESGSGTGTFTSSITGLSCETTYYVRAYATNSEGTGYGEQVSFSTLECPPGLPVLSTTDVTNIYLYSAEGGGDITDDGGSSIMARGICWNTSSNPTISDHITEDGTGTGLFTSYISGLAPNTIYFVKAYATNSVGTSYGDELTFKTWYGSVTDYDGNEYPIVEIGGQIWMQENINVTHYADGSAIPLVENSSVWDTLGHADLAYCWYDNDVANGEVFGALYTWAAAMGGASGSEGNPSGVQGVCPDNWHMPSDAEWKELEIYLGMSQEEADGDGFRGTDEADKLKEGSDLWINLNVDGTNSSGFAARPGGLRFNSGEFMNLNSNALFWTATDYHYSGAWTRLLYNQNADVGRIGYSKNVGLSVRCIKDDGSSTRPAVTTAIISNVTTSSAQSGGEVTSDGGAAVTAYGVCWSTSQTPTISDLHTTDGAGTGVFTSSLGGLTPNTTYYVRAYATNSEGTAYGSQESFTTYGAGKTITDYDGNIYGTVQIGDQVWMAENLKVTTYEDGTDLVDGTSVGAITGDQKTKYYFVHNDNPLRLEIYGLLYTWAAVMDGAAGSDALPSGIQGVCPDGWHVPSDVEWQILEKELGMSESEVSTMNWRGTDQGTQLKAGGDSGFEGLLGGYRDHNGSSYDLGNRGSFWSSTDDGSNAYIRQLGATTGQVRRIGTDKSNACSMRCVKD